MKSSQGSSGRRSDWKKRLKNVGVIAIATGGGLGFFPLASGTMGSLLGAVIIWLLWSVPTFIQVLLCIAMTAIGVWASGRANKIFGKVDSSRIVIDEIAGMMVTMIAIPSSLDLLGIGFVVFRILDIVKPAPAHYFDSKVKNGWGVVMDDIVAGIYGNVCMQLMVRTRI